jgi:hypothetical protein
MITGHPLTLSPAPGLKYLLIMFPRGLRPELYAFVCSAHFMSIKYVIAHEKPG